MTSAPSRCMECLVRDTSLCAAMDDQQIERLSSIGRRNDYTAGDVITWSGDPNTLCANIVSGVVKVTTSTPDGREQIVGLLYPGDFVGQPFSEEATMTATAVQPTDLCMFPRGPFKQVLTGHQRMEQMLLERTMISLNEAQQRLLALGRRNAGERIAGFLLEVVEKTLEEEDDILKIELPISRGEMADYLGLTIETVSRQFAKLRKDGVIAMAKGDRTCTILDRDRLEMIADPE